MIWSQTKRRLDDGEVILSITMYKADWCHFGDWCGQHQMIALRYFNYKKTRTQVTSGGLGTMGFALPAAFRSQLTIFRGTGCLCWLEDGGIQMTIQEPLVTIMQNKGSRKNRFGWIIISWMWDNGSKCFWQALFPLPNWTTPIFVKNCRKHTA